MWWSCRCRTTCVATSTRQADARVRRDALASRARLEVTTGARPGGSRIGAGEADPRRPPARRRPSKSTSGSPRSSRSRSSRPTRSRRPRTRPRRSSSSPRSARRACSLGLETLIPIGIAVALLLAIVAFSYRQTIFAYPSGGGSYVVSRENLGENRSLIAGASLLVDYILTVAVSISAGVAAIVSIPEFEDLGDHRVLLGLALIVLITLANLRGLKESGRLFAAPTYLYIVVLVGADRLRPRRASSPATSAPSRSTRRRSTARASTVARSGSS